MRYTKFRIENYRAITGTLEINLEKNSLIPIIGVNESGKTKILHALFAFDYYNDRLNDNGRHLRDIHNLYKTTQQDAVVSAEVLLNQGELRTAIDELAKLKLSDPESAASLTKDVRRYKRLAQRASSRLMISRNLKTKRYSLDSAGVFDDEKMNHYLSRGLISRLPYILFFDDFRDSVDERIEIAKDESGEVSGWLSILEQLFADTDPTFSVFKIPTLEERARSTMLARVNRRLNATLTKEWQNFRLDETDALRIALTYEKSSNDGTDRHFFKLDVIERDADGFEYHFYIRDRSKGFYWFFNFVMKLEFNPKVVNGDEASGAIYLLDEPGSYLHASAQTKLCAKLRSLSARNDVVYCTHSHYLLDPEIIPLNNIRVADKDGHGSVRLMALDEHPGSILERRSAFQPVVDALQIKPFLFDLSHQNVIITEGIVDYYALEMFKQGRNVNVLPSVGADSIRFYVSLMIAWRLNYCALWDNDPEGRKCLRKAAQLFGERVARERFYLLPLRGASAKNRILQNLFDGDDLRMIRVELGMNGDAGFDQTLASLYYHENRSDILARV